MYEYKATVLSIHDGDTVTFDLDLGFDVHVHHPLRLYGINAPELSTDAGKHSRDYLTSLIKPGDVVTVSTTKLQWDKYGRYLGTITLADGRVVNELMVTSLHAVHWDGLGPKPVV